MEQSIKLESQSIENENVATNKLEEIAPVKKSREFWLDFMKGILTISMILAHIYQFFTYNPAFFNLNDYINLTTFSAFMFCFGYASFLAYADNPNAEKRMLIGLIKSVIAFYVSGFAYYFFYFKARAFVLYLDIIFFVVSPGYSEFLLSFALIYVVEIFLFKWLLKLTENKIKFFLVIALSLILTKMFRSEASNFPIVSSLIGGKNTYSFPIVQYGVYFLMGLYLAKYKIRFNVVILIFSILGSLAFIYFRIRYNALPLRFPSPSIYWIVGGMFFVYAYYLLCRFVKKNNFVCFFGRNSLFYLVATNVILFFTVSIRDTFTINNYPIFWLIMLAICLGLPTIILQVYTAIKKTIKNFREQLKAVENEDNLGQ